MLYTIVPLAQVLEGLEEDPAPTLQLEGEGMTLEVEPLSRFQARVVRVVSTDPRHYLDPRYQPGTVLKGSLF